MKTMFDIFRKHSDDDDVAGVSVTFIDSGKWDAVAEEIWREIWAKYILLHGAMERKREFIGYLEKFSR